MSSFPVVPIVKYDVNPQAMVEAGHVVATLRFALERPDASLTELVAQLLEERAGLLINACAGGPPDTAAA